MSFRRTGHSDERRRRVLRDDVRGAAAEEDAGAADTGPKKRGPASGVAGRRYSTAALANRQPPVTCLIAKRRLTLAALALVGLSVIAGLETLYTHVYCRLPAERRALCAALDVDGSGSLAAWWSALLLAAGAAGSLMVYALRRHRLDDYRARYRVWLWAACAFLLGSADAATGSHVGLARLAVDLQGERLRVGEQLWSTAILTVVFGLVGVRLLVEIRSSFSAVTMLTLAAAAYATAGCVAARALVVESQLLSAMLYSTCLLVGHFGLLMAVWCYARFVYREAQEDAPRRARKSAKPSDAERREAAPGRSRQLRTPRNVRVDPAHSTNRVASPAPAAAAAQFTPSPPMRDEDEEDADDADQSSSLSRAERRRLRKQLRRQGSSG